MRRFACASVLLVALAAAPLHAATLLVDGTFLNSDWATSKLQDTTVGATATGNSSQSVAGGNPGAYRSTTHSWNVVPAGVSIVFAHLNTAFTWNPSTQGELLSIDITFNAIANTAPVVNAIAFGGILEQGGVVYRAIGGAALVGFGWQNISMLNLTESSFVDAYNTGLANPDFSTSGAPIRFGYYSANGGSGFTSGLTAQGGVDNFSVAANVNPIPEPATLGMLSLAALAMVRRR